LTHRTLSIQLFLFDRQRREECQPRPRTRASLIQPAAFSVMLNYKTSPRAARRLRGRTLGRLEWKSEAEFAAPDPKRSFGTAALTAEIGRYRNGGCGVSNDKSRRSFLELVDGRKRPSGRQPAAPVGIPLKDQHEANNGTMISARRGLVRAWAPQVLGETSHQSRSELRTGAKARPHAVRPYSTRGGTWW
jgi:hypothetical protein